MSEQNEPGAEEPQNPTEPNTAENKIAEKPGVGAKLRQHWKQLSKPTQVWVGGILTAAVTAVVVTWAVATLGPANGQPATAPTPIGAEPGHPPGPVDVSTMKPGQRFYAVPNFYEDPGCGRPCYAPAYLQATNDSTVVTTDWPCEYYNPKATLPPSTCVNPPPKRTRNEMADAARADSGDRVFVLCQVKGQTLQTSPVQRTNIWDEVAIPAALVLSQVIAAHNIPEIPGMPGYYESFISNLWLGNTGWHSIPCH